MGEGTNQLSGGRVVQKERKVRENAKSKNAVSGARGRGAGRGPVRPEGREVARQSCWASSATGRTWIFLPVRGETLEGPEQTWHDLAQADPSGC